MTMTIPAEYLPGDPAAHVDQLGLPVLVPGHAHRAPASVHSYDTRRKLRCPFIDLHMNGRIRASSWAFKFVDLAVLHCIVLAGTVSVCAGRAEARPSAVRHAVS